MTRERSVLTSLLLQTLINSLAIVLIWGFQSCILELGPLRYHIGNIRSGFVVLRSRFSSAIVGRPEPGQELIVSGTSMFVRGAASASSGFVAATLLKDDA